MTKMDISTLKQKDMVYNDACLKGVMPYHMTECECSQIED